VTRGVVGQGVRLFVAINAHMRSDVIQVNRARGAAGRNCAGYVRKQGGLVMVSHNKRGVQGGIDEIQGRCAICEAFEDGRR
jgi:hypothetical protein